MPEARECPECGAELPSGSPGSLCVLCALREGLDQPSEDLVPNPSTIRVEVQPEKPGESSLPSGTTVEYFGDYVILSKIAHGGMGVVYKARQVSLNRLVALKMILSGHLASESQVARFRVEAEAAANLAHPNIVPIYEIGEHEGRHYFSMELVDGKNLRTELRRYTKDLKAAVRLVVTVARAVEHAHQRGILHRDLKPENVLIDQQGQPHVTDFGLARRLERDVSLTESGKAMGTPNYMSPEQVMGRSREMTTAVDVWALGVILYELLTARLPFQASSEHEISRRILEEEPHHPSLLNPEIARDLETICLRCLDKENPKRRGSAEDLARRLETWQNGGEIDIQRYSIWERLVKWVKRNKLAFGAASAVSVALLLGTIVSVWQAKQARQSQRETRTVLDFLSEKVLAAARPKKHEGGLGPDVTVHQAVESAEPQIRGLFTNRPATEAAVRVAIGRTYHFLGNYAEAIQQFELAFALDPVERKGSLQDDQIRGLVFLAESYIAAGRANDAVKLLDSNQSLISSTASALLKQQFERVREQAVLLSEKSAEAVSMLEPDIDPMMRSIQSRYSQRVVGRSRPSFSPPREFHVAARAKEIGKTVLAQPLSYESEFIRMNAKHFAWGNVIGKVRTRTLADLFTLAEAIEPMHPKEAATLYADATKLAMGSLGQTNECTIHALLRLARCYAKAGDIVGYITNLESVLHICADKNVTIALKDELAAAYLKARRTEEALRLQKEVEAELLPVYKEGLSAQNAEPLELISLLTARGDAQMKSGRLLYAIATLEHAVGVGKARLSRSGNYLQENAANAKLAEAYAKIGRINEAVDLYQQSLEKTVLLMGTNHPQTMEIRKQLSELRAVSQQHSPKP